MHHVQVLARYLAEHEKAKQLLLDDRDGLSQTAHRLAEPLRSQGLHFPDHYAYELVKAIVGLFGTLPQTFFVSSKDMPFDQSLEILISLPQAIRIYVSLPLFFQFWVDAPEFFQAIKCGDCSRLVPGGIIRSLADLAAPEEYHPNRHWQQCPIVPSEATA